MTVLQQVLLPQVSRAYRGGLDQAEGFVVDASDVAFARTAVEVVEAFGWASLADRVLEPDGSVSVLRAPVTPFVRVAPALDARVAGPEDAALVEPPPFTGTGFTGSQAAMVPLWRVARTRLPPGTEMWRVAADGQQSLVDVYRSTDTTLTCQWRGAPFEVVNSDSQRATLTYVGGDHRVAEQLGLAFAQPGVYEVTVERDELDDVQAVARELQLGRTGPSA